MSKPNPLSALTAESIEANIKVQLRPKQQAALRAFLAASEQLGPSLLNVAATGFGKTIMIGAIAKAYEMVGWRSLVLAHRESLIVGNADKINKVFGAEVSGVEMAARRVFAETLVTSASVGSLHEERLDDLLARWALPNDQRNEDGYNGLCVMVDEAHHMPASSYRAVIDKLRAAFGERMVLQGFTATPFRADGVSLSEFFDGEGFCVLRGELIEGGELARDHCFTVRTETTLAGLKSTGGDYNEKALALRVDNEERNALILDTASRMRDRFQGRPAERGGPLIPRAVCFLSSVEHARVMAERFAADGWESIFLSGKSKTEERRRADERLKKAEGPVIVCNCELLTEGWDVEEVNLGLLARPTKSNVKMDQMIGRLLRKKDEANNWASLVYFEDADAEKGVTMSAAFRLPPLWDCGGRSARADDLWLTAMLEKCRGNPHLQGAIWLAKSRQEVGELLSDPSRAPFAIVHGRDFLWWIVGGELRAVTKGWNCVLSQDDMGDWRAELRAGPTERTFIGRASKRTALLDQAELWIEHHYPQESIWLRNAQKPSWETMAPTEKMLEALKKMRARGDRRVPPDDRLERLSKRDASILISASQMESGILTESGCWSWGKFRGQPIRGRRAAKSEEGAYRRYLFGVMKGIEESESFRKFAMAKVEWPLILAELKERNLWQEPPPSSPPAPDASLRG